MATLLEYLKPETLEQLQDGFSAAARAPVRICGPDGLPLTRESRLESGPEGQPAQGGAGGGDGAGVGEGPAGALEVPILVDCEVVGRIRCEPPAAPPGEVAASCDRSVQLLRLMANVIGRLCDRQKELHARVDELATLYHLTAEFAGRRSLQSLLDLIAQTVVNVLKAKACSIRLLSDDRKELVIKAVANLSSEYLDKGPIPISESKVDQQVLGTLKPVYVADERTDPRVLYPAEARREGIVSGLSAPLVYKGRPEGVIRVYMAEVHEFDWFEMSLLQAIAAQAAAAIVNARLYAEAVQAADIKRQLQLAAEVQRGMIPAQPPKIAGFDVGAIYVPCFELGGDFYDFIDLPPDNVGIAICDVVGKGVRASLLMASIRASLRAHAVNIYDMSKVLSLVNGDLCADALASDFATLFYAVLEKTTGRFTYANAGHARPLLVQDSKARWLSAGGGVLGIDPQSRWTQEWTFLRKGDVVLAYTDGLTEAMNFEDQYFGPERVERAALEAMRQGLTADGIVRYVLWEMRRFAGLQTWLDDLTLVAIKTL